MTEPVSITEESLRTAVAILRSGGIIGFPTETYYGLAVDPFNPKALERLFQAKKRPSHLPILVLVHGLEQLASLTPALPLLAIRLIDRFWPGPLTLVCKALPDVPGLLTGGTGTVGFRHSSNSPANRLVAAFGRPITATSANISGSLPAVTAAETARIFGDTIDLVLDGGTTPGGSGSTLVTIRDGVPHCLRQGQIAFTAVQACAASAPEKR